MPTNDFVPFATGGSANVETQVAYLADPTTTNGFAAGIAFSDRCNKVWRQGTFMAAVIGEFIKSMLGIDVLDDADLAGKTTDFIDAIAQVPSALGSFVTVNAATFTAVAADRNKTIRMTGTGAGTHNFALPDPATLDARWCIRLIVDSADGDFVSALPGGAGTLDGSTNRRSGVGTDVLIQCDGTNFFTVQGKYRFKTAYAGWTANSELTAVHNFAKPPQQVLARMKATTAQFGYSIGDTVTIITTNADNAQGMVTMMTDASGNTTRFLIAAGIAVTRKDTHVNAGFVTPADWQIQLEMACR